MSLMALALAALILSSPASAPISKPLPDFGKDPTVNLSAIRQLNCTKLDGRKYMGTGFMIAKNTLATALHVGIGLCRDNATNEPLTLYHQEPQRDFALMRLSLDVGPYIKYSCRRFETGKYYNSYGYSSYMQSRVIFRQSRLQALKGYKDFTIQGKYYKPMRHLYGPMVFGHSGGPIISATGYAHGMNNVGDTVQTFFGLFNTGDAFSTELADTILCRLRSPDEEDTSPAS